MMSDDYDTSSAVTTVRLALLGIILIAIIVLIAFVPWRGWFQRVRHEKLGAKKSAILPTLTTKPVATSPLPPAVTLVTPIPSPSSNPTKTQSVAYSSEPAHRLVVHPIQHVMIVRRPRRLVTAVAGRDSAIARAVVSDAFATATATAGVASASASASGDTSSSSAAATTW